MGLFHERGSFRGFIRAFRTETDSVAVRSVLEEQLDFSLEDREATISGFVRLMQNSVYNSERKFLVAHANDGIDVGRVVGIVGYADLPENFKRLGSTKKPAALGEMNVVSEFQGQGVGWRLRQAIESEARAAGFTELICVTEKDEEIEHFKNLIRLKEYKKVRVPQEYLRQSPKLFAIRKTLQAD